MKPLRPLLAAAVSGIALAYAVAAHAQAGPPADPAAPTEAAPADQTDIVVTGTRTTGRSRLDSVSPVDVLSAATLQRQGTTELGASLAAVVPSIDFPRSSAVDGTDSIRPATLRGLSPDQTLVLINGVRAHTSALLNTNGSVGRGSAAVDLNTIPSVALDRIEVLRDGAAAQYGSDAIAGVVNLRLREARSGGGASVTYGQYITDVRTARGDRSERDGETVTASAWQGLALGSDGFLTLSGEYLNRNPTSRGDFDPRKTPIRVRSRFGDPDVEQYSFYANAAKPLDDSGFTLYGFGGYQHRDSVSAATPRIVGGVGGNANASADALASLYPDGFTPLIAVTSEDLTATAGLRGDIAGWKTDLSVSYGRNQLKFDTRNSGNATYGAASQTDFYDGKITYDQLVTGLDVSREVPLGAGTLNVAFGGEYRREGFQIGAGEHASYDRAPGAASNLGSGAQGFPGFLPSNEVNKHRDNVSGYLDLEAKPVEGLTLGAAGRLEHYSDFGTTVNGKLSARYDFTPWFALRGTVSTGFRAPSLQQQYYTSTASVLTDGAIVETGLFPSTSRVGVALGGKALKPEKAVNYSAGFVIRHGGFDLSVDGYYIKIRDQIALSENLSGATVIQRLRDEGITSVTAGRYFLNGIRSTAKGVDIVAHYRAPTASLGTFDLTAATNINNIDVTRAPPAATITSSTGSTTLPVFSRQRIVSFEQGTPREKVVGTIDWSLDKLGATARASYYGDVTQPSSNGFAEDDIHTGRHTIVDLELRYTLLERINLAVGANNILDEYPDYVKLASSRGTVLNSTGLVGFPYYSPFGFNGRYVYGRVGVNW
ncbi:TonB-dependent siderophore receptor [Sphingomonas sp. NFR15]|uniref:TonB-dependent receptor plug domain-containing protein n=1 Tax=Sphingomonas sp. NFR15 TaxID=1566282 RepID=UPI00088CF8B8|nr:TonB-dependent receptor [Sphingomonas sp. NFR15]SDA32413.1 iron complex outermembrane recepter protein [Sphingomonas sp. NFR15]